MDSHTKLMQMAIEREWTPEDLLNLAMTYMLEDEDLFEGFYDFCELEADLEKQEEAEARAEYSYEAGNDALDGAVGFMVQPEDMPSEPYKSDGLSGVNAQIAVELAQVEAELKAAFKAGADATKPPVAKDVRIQAILRNDGNLHIQYGVPGETFYSKKSVLLTNTEATLWDHEMPHREMASSLAGTASKYAVITDESKEMIIVRTTIQQVRAQYEGNLESSTLLNRHEGGPSPASIRYVGGPDVIGEVKSVPSSVSSAVTQTSTSLSSPPVTSPSLPPLPSSVGTYKRYKPVVDCGVCRWKRALACSCKGHGWSAVPDPRPTGTSIDIVACTLCERFVATPEGKADEMAELYVFEKYGKKLKQKGTQAFFVWLDEFLSDEEHLKRLAQLQACLAGEPKPHTPGEGKEHGCAH